METMLFPIDKRNEFDSFQAGRSFGKLFAQFFPIKSIVDLFQLVRTFRLSSTLDRECYEYGFITSYLKHSGNQVTTNEQLEELEKTIMGKLLNAKKATQGFNGYVKLSQLAENSVVFCIKSIASHDGAYGPQWDLEIEVGADSALILGMGDRTEAQVSIGYKTDALNGRDRMLDALRDETPVHCVYVETIARKNGNPFYNLDEALDPICVCGHVMRDDFPEESGELANKPF